MSSTGKRIYRLELKDEYGGAIQEQELVLTENELGEFQDSMLDMQGAIVTRRNIMEWAAGE